jgi:17beta-estradiol 17-dehydrogenase / very-long-chain 3-oxoacyl-CoA reductase
MLVLIAAIIGLQILYAVYKYFIRPAKNLSKYGSYAIVTGATDGIGKAIAIELAKKRINLVLISRTESKLRDLADEIEKKYSVKTKVIPVDFGRFDEQTQETVRQAISDLDVGILVNNVGQSYPYPMYEHEVTDQLRSELVALNVESTYRMSRIVMPLFLAKKSKQKGAIINISSMASHLSLPLLAHYAATKGYIEKLSVAMHHEYKKQGIDVQVQIPALVTSKLSKLRHASLTVPSPATYARAAVKQFGRDACISPYWVHALEQWLASWVGESLRGHLGLMLHVPLRKKALAKEKER